MYKNYILFFHKKSKIFIIHISYLILSNNWEILKTYFYVIWFLYFVINYKKI